MSKKTPSTPIGASFRLAVVVALQMLASLPAIAASPAPLRAVDRDPRANWIEAFDWGGGARFVFDLKQSKEAGAPSLNFLAGGAPEFAFGCADQDPTKSYWRFRVGATPPGSGITSRDEIAHERGMKYYFGAPGMLVLLDEADKEIKRTPLTPRNGALETAALRQDDVRAILNASAIRAETPRIYFESGTSALKATIDRNAKLPCATPELAYRSHPLPRSQRPVS
ncbi:hypothetical protein JJT62_13445 [Methylocystis sp. Sn-Cys]|nr:hypothetical protein [Methylocystis sp. Sn-Cys]